MSMRFDSTTSARLSDRDYLEFVLSSIETARWRIWVSMFIFDIRPSRDVRGSALSLARALAARRSVGVDVRVLLTGAVSTPDIAVANIATGLFLSERGVAQRRVMAGELGRQGSHAKYAIFDDVSVVGSQNWTDDGFSTNVEDAAVLFGPASDRLAHEFREYWSLAKGLPGGA